MSTPSSPMEPATKTTMMMMDGLLANCSSASAAEDNASSPGSAATGIPDEDYFNDLVEEWCDQQQTLQQQQQQAEKLQRQRQRQALRKQHESTGSTGSLYECRERYGYMTADDMPVGSPRQMHMMSNDAFLNDDDDFGRKARQHQHRRRVPSSH